MRDAAPMVDTRAPQTYMHLHLKLKKLQVSGCYRTKPDNTIALTSIYLQNVPGSDHHNSKFHAAVLHGICNILSFSKSMLGSCQQQQLLRLPDLSEKIITYIDLK